MREEKETFTPEEIEELLRELEVLNSALKNQTEDLDKTEECD